MNRRITRTVVAAAGGLLAAAFLPVASAFADVYSIDPESQEVITSVSGIPPFYETTMGTESFGLDTGFDGYFNADVSTFQTSSGFVNQEIVATGSGGAVPTGSIFDFTNFGGGYENEYSDIPAGPDAITDTFITPFGDFNIPTTFDALALFSMPDVTIP